MPFADNRKIAKNTVLLYVRMLLVMGVSLYTTRVILKILGIDDYGIYTLIGGFISLFSIISNSLVAAIQRYFNVALGKNDTNYFGRIYSMSINMLGIMSIIFLLIAETLGLWFITTQLNIPKEREFAAFWVYQLSIITLIVQLFRSPDNASIISHEAMSFFSVLGILETILKLVIVYALSIVGFDKLISYCVLYLIVTLLINIIYLLYCRKKYEYCRYKRIWDVRLMKELSSFSGWTLMGNGVQIGVLQGENFVLNHYYSVSVNAARGVASQVYNALNLFLVNFQTAFQPQLMKTFVADEKEDFLTLLFRTSRLSYFLLLVLVVPAVFNMNSLLSVWLEKVPPYTNEFCIYVLFAYLADALSAPLAMSISASGKIKRVQMILSLIFILQFIASFLSLMFKAVPYVVSIYILCSHVLMFTTYLYYAYLYCNIQIRLYFRKVVLPSLMVSVLAAMLPFLISCNHNSIILIAVYFLIDFIWVGIIVFYLGLKKSERDVILKFILNKVRYTYN